MKNFLSFNKQESNSDISFPINCLVDGINDIESISYLSSNISSLNPTIIQISNRLTFMSFRCPIELFNDIIEKEIKILNCEIFSIFHINSTFIISQNKLKSDNLFYLFYEDKSATFSNRLKPKNEKYFKLNQKKCFHGFNNFDDLTDFYADLIAKEKIWPVYAIFPSRKQNKTLKNSPEFKPIKSLFYVGFIENNSQEPSHIKNVKELFSIKNINDVQINHSFNKSIRTFLGFDNNFKCHQVFDFLNQKKSFENIILLAEPLNSKINIKHNLFYLEIKSLSDFSVLYSLDYLNSFINDNKTVLGFGNYNDFLFAKKLLLFYNKSNDLTIKKIRLIEKEEIDSLFPDQNLNENMFYIMFRLKNFSNNKKSKIIFSKLTSNANFVMKDVVCSFDNKIYTIIGFVNDKKRKDSFLSLKNSEYNVKLNSYLPINFRKPETPNKKIDKKTDLNQEENKDNISVNKKSDDKFKYHYNDDELSNSNNKKIENKPININNDNKIESTIKNKAEKNKKNKSSKFYYKFNADDNDIISYKSEEDTSINKSNVDKNSENNNDIIIKEKEIEIPISKEIKSNYEGRNEEISKDGFDEDHITEMKEQINNKMENKKQINKKKLNKKRAKQVELAKEQINEKNQKTEFKTNNDKVEKKQVELKGEQTDENIRQIKEKNEPMDKSKEKIQINKEQDKEKRLSAKNKVKQVVEIKSKQFEEKLKQKQYQTKFKEEQVLEKKKQTENEVKQIEEEKKHVKIQTEQYEEKKKQINEKKENTVEYKKLLENKTEQSEEKIKEMKEKNDKTKFKEKQNKEAQKKKNIKVKQIEENEYVGIKSEQSEEKIMPIKEKKDQMKFKKEQVLEKKKNTEINVNQIEENKYIEIKSEQSEEKEKQTEFKEEEEKEKVEEKKKQTEFKKEKVEDEIKQTELKEEKEKVEEKKKQTEFKEEKDEKKTEQINNLSVEEISTREKTKSINLTKENETIEKNKCNLIIPRRNNTMFRMRKNNYLTYDNENSNDNDEYINNDEYIHNNNNNKSSYTKKESYNEYNQSRFRKQRLRKRRSYFSPFLNPFMGYPFIESPLDYLFFLYAASKYEFYEYEYYYDYDYSDDFDFYDEPYHDRYAYRKRAFEIIRSISEVQIDIKNSFQCETENFVYLSQSTIPNKIISIINAKFKTFNEFKEIKTDICHPNDPNNLYTFYLFTSLEFSPKTILYDFISQQGIKTIDPGKNDLFFDEKMIPDDILPSFLNHLKKIKNITTVENNVFDGNQICTYLTIKNNYQNNIFKSIQSFLSKKKLVYNDDSKFKLENCIVINEKMILKNSLDFIAIVEEIKGQNIKITNSERNKLYIYDEKSSRKLFQLYSFISFQNEKEKIKALNHVNKIIFKDKENILELDENLFYASFDENIYPENLRNLIPDVLNTIKGFKKIHRCAASFESPVEKTYIGFDSIKHLKKCYHKFNYKLNVLRYCKEPKLFVKKSETKYYYLMIKVNHNKAVEDVIKKLSGAACDIQENCTDFLGKNLQYNNTYLGFASFNDLIDFKNEFVNDPVIKNDPVYITEFHEGKTFIHYSADVKELYLYYNCI